MNMRHTLTLLAATVAPLYAQQAPQDPVTTTLAAMQASPSSPATAEQRSQAFPALAFMPAEVAAVLTTGNIKPFLEMVDPASAHIGSTLSVAIGATESSALLASDLISLGQSLQTSMNGNDAANKVMSAMSGSVLDIVKGMKGKTISPTYLLIDTDNPEFKNVMEDLDETYEQAKKSLADAALPSSCEGVYDFNGFKGYKFNLEKLLAQDIHMGKIADPALAAELKELISGRTVYVGYCQVGKTLAFTITEKPEETKLAATPAQSILGTDKLGDFDANLNKHALLAAYIAPSVMGKQIKDTKALILRSLEAMAAMAKQKMPAQNPDKAMVEQGLLGLGTICKAVEALYPDQTKSATTLHVWMDSDVHVEFTGSAGNWTQENGQLKLTAQSANKDNIFYYEGTTIHCAGMPAVDELLDAAEAIAMSAAVVGGDQAEVNQLKQSIAAYQMFKPQIWALGSHLGTIGDGLGNTTSIVVRLQDQKDVPACIALQLPVTDRAKLNEGWQNTLRTAGSIIATFGGDPAIVNALPIASQPGANGSTAYTVMLPMLPGIMPNLQVSDTNLVAGTSAALTADLMQTATGSVNCAGSVFSFNVGAAAKLARTIADTMREQEETARPSISAEEVYCNCGEASCAECQNADTQDFEDYEDYEEIDYVVEPDTPADNAEDIADLLEEGAQYVDSIHAASTISNGKQKVRMDIILRKP